MKAPLPPFQDTPQARVVIAVVLVVLVLALAGIGYLLVSQWMLLTSARSAPGAADGARPAVLDTRQPEVRRLMYRMAVLLAALLLILIFVVGSYLLIRIGRAITRKPVGGQPTEYVDAWSRYRLSDEEIARATNESPAAGGGNDSSPRDNGTEPSDEDSNGSGEDR